MKDKIYLGFFFASVFIILTGAVLKILHWQGGEYFIFTGLFLYVKVVGLSLMEIFSFKSLTISEKWMWVFGFLVFNFLALTLYYFSRRPQLLRKNLLRS